MDEKENFISSFKNWVKDEPKTLCAVLVGSHARGTAKKDSDIDIVIVTETPADFLDDESWLKNFGGIKKIAREDYKLVQARRVFYSNELEVEFGITTPTWLNKPLDPGTKRVLDDGYEILDDKGRLFVSLGTN